MTLLPPLCKQNGNTPLHYTADSGKVASLAALLIEKGADVDRTDEVDDWGVAGFIHAVTQMFRFGLCWLVRHMRELIVLPNESLQLQLAEITSYPPLFCKQDGNTPLLLALKKDHLKLATLLIEKRASVDIANKVSD